MAEALVGVSLKKCIKKVECIKKKKPHSAVTALTLTESGISHIAP